MYVYISVYIYIYPCVYIQYICTYCRQTDRKTNRQIEDINMVST